MWCTRTRDYFHDTPRGVSGLLSLWSASFAFIYRCSPSCCPPSPPLADRHAGPSPFHLLLLLLLFVAVQPHQKLIAVLLHVPSFSSSIQIFLSKIELDYWFEIATDLDVQLSGYIYNFWLFFSWFLILRSSLLEKLNRVTITNASEKNLR